MRDVGLELEADLQRALADLGLVRRVGRRELGAAEHTATAAGTKWR